MKMMGIPQRSQKVQLLRYKNNVVEYRQCSDNDTIEYLSDKHLTEDYSQIIFPKFSTVDIPGDQYSVAVIRHPRVQVDEETGSSADMSDGGNVQGSVRRSSTDQCSEKTQRPYSVAKNEWSLIV
jgi:hypothetical protein